MALYTIFIESGGKVTSTQVEAQSAAKAFEDFIDRYYATGAQKHLGAAAPDGLSSADILYLVPMDGLTNMWIGQAGRDGKYISAVFARTVPRKKAL